MKKKRIIRKKIGPRVSVVMPVFNAENFLRESLDSILKQTHRNFEFIIVDDGSTDASFKILRNYASVDKRIKLFRNPTNMGVSRAVNRAISKAKGEYIARMDADDIALPRRLEQQVAHLKKNPTTIAVGGQCLLIDKRGSVIGKKTFPIHFKQIYQYIFEFVPLQQPTLMIARKRLPKNFAYYYNGMNTAEELELLFKLFLYGKVENISDPVLLYRLHDHNTSFTNVRQTFGLTLISRLNAVYHYNYKPSKRGITITLLQAIFVYMFPQQFSLSVYKIMRSLTLYKSPTLMRARTLSPKSLMSPASYRV